MRLGRIYFDHTAEGYKKVKENGLDFVEICCNYDKDVEWVVGEREYFKNIVEESGVEIGCLGKWNHELLVNGTVDRVKLDSYVKLLDTAAYLGAKTFVCGCNYDDSISLYKNYTNAIEVFGTLTEYASGKGIKVAVENCDWNNFVVCPEQWKVILGELPELCIKYDPSHAYNRNANYLDELADWGHRVAHVHIKGTTHAGKDGMVDDPPAGMDDLNWPSIFAVLYATGYDGDLSIEPHSETWRGELGEKGVNFTRDFIRKFMLR